MKLNELFALNEYATKTDFGAIGVNPSPDEFRTRLEQSPYGVVRFIIKGPKLYVWGQDVWHVDMVPSLGLAEEFADDTLLTGYFTRNAYYADPRYEPELTTDHPRVKKMFGAIEPEQLDDIP